MEDAPTEVGRIKGYAFTHDVKGGKIYKNILFPKEYVEKYDSNGNKYEFQWEYQGVGRSTSIITKGFLKLYANINPQIIGQVSEAGLRWIEDQNFEYIICDISIKKASQINTN